jgi:hypothetical protein
MSVVRWCSSNNGVTFQAKTRPERKRKGNNQVGFLMKRQKLYLFWLLIAVMSAGCGRPSAQVVPTIDTSARETALAGTAIAAFGTATPIPSPTKTPVPTVSVSSYGTSVTRREDGSTVFVDQRAYMQITFPANWLAMRVGEPEYYQAWEGEASRNPQLLDAITSIQNLDLNQFRITAFDMLPDHMIHENLPKINVVFIQNDDRTLRRIEYDERTAKSILKDYKFLPSTFKTMPSGLEILIIQHQWEASSDGKQPYSGYYRGVLFKVPNGTVAIDLFIPLEQKELFEPELDQIVSSITISKP